MDTNHWKRNITLLYITSALSWGRFFLPVIALFYIASKVPLDQFTIIMSVFALTILLFEIPSGVLADFIGKKKCLIFSRILFLAEILILAFGMGFWPFLIAKILSGVAVSLLSGTEEAVLYESLKKLGREKEYKKQYANMLIVDSIVMAVVFIIGGYLFSISNKFPAIISIIPMVAGIVFTLFIKEPYIREAAMTLKASYDHAITSLKFYWKKTDLRFLGLLILPFAAMVNIAQSLSSVYLTIILIPVSLIGLVAFAASLLSGYGAKNSDRLEKRYGERKMLIISYIFVLFGMFLMSFMAGYIGVLFYLMINLFDGVFSASISHYVNRKITSERHRTTILSINSSFSNLGMFIFLPVAGYLVKIKSMSFSLWYIAVFFAVYAVVLRLAFRKIIK